MRSPIKDKERGQVPPSRCAYMQWPDATSKQPSTLSCKIWI